MKLSLLGFCALDETIDSFAREMIAYVPCDLAVVFDPFIELFAVLTHGSFPLALKQRAIVKCVPLESELDR
ncbi:hypothetical protein [Bradyrhizobium sp. CCGUVB23]|uniref:hypothetical protein n=1 Tax=Bradyrhizobium sp. CCGUVB23 TaxID=2949630 RepID=UPI0020B22E15|nr:hypothetical protein [Bradyrhizobium sp. CCGUVB23]MCP3459635.1 hypothetical protein [Bradyrhizobium sp. CCGUVB23]